MPFAPLPPARSRQPFVSSQTKNEPPEPGVTLVIHCGRLQNEDEYLADGWDFIFKKDTHFQDRLGTDQ